MDGREGQGCRCFQWRAPAAPRDCKVVLFFVLSCRLDEATQAMSKVSNDHRLALVHIDQLRTQNDELFKALEAAEGASRCVLRGGWRMAARGGGC